MFHIRCVKVVALTSDGEMQICCSLIHQCSDWAFAAGPFTGLEHMVLLADRTPSRPLRHTLLHVLQAALLPASASLPQPAGSAQSPVVALAATAAGGNRAEAAAAVTANCAAFLAAGGVQFAVDLLASAPFAIPIKSTPVQACAEFCFCSRPCTVT